MPSSTSPAAVPEARPAAPPRPAAPRGSRGRRLAVPAPGWRGRRPALALLALGAALALAAPPPAAAAQDPAQGAGSAPARPRVAPREWAFAAGVFDLAKSDRAEAGAEARFEPLGLRLLGRRFALEPALGALANEDGGFYGYFSLRLPLDLGDRWRATPFTGAGVYSAGDGKDLGGPVEFRSGLELAVRLGGRARLGLSYAHLSNAVLYDRNPGAESLALVVSFRP